VSRKQLTVLIVIAALLAVLVIAKKLDVTPPDIETEVGLTALAPPGFFASDVARVELYVGGEKELEQRAILARDADDRWLVESRYSAPAAEKKVANFLGMLKTLTGEYRSKGKGVLEDYHLTDAKAKHIALYKAGETNACYHLAIGKEAGTGRCFVRRAGDDGVYTVNVDLAGEMGIADGGAPDSSGWVEKTIVKLDENTIVRLAVETPDRAVAFEHRELQDKEKKDGNDEHAGHAHGKKIKREWVHVHGGLGMTYQKSGIEDLARSLHSFTASDVEDPAMKKAFGLDAPGYHCTAKMADGSETTIIGSWPVPGGDAYVMLKGNKTVYRVSSWTFNDVFGKGDKLFMLPALRERDEDVTKITLTYPDGTKVRLGRSSGRDWNISSPALPLAFKKSAAENVAKALATWKPDDYADGGNLASFGLSQPVQRAEFSAVNGRTHTLRVGRAARGAKGRYVLLDDNKKILVADNYNIERIFPKLKKFFEADVLKVEEGDIAKIAVMRANDPFEIRKTGGAWQLFRFGEKVEADAAKVADYVKKFGGLSPEDIAPLKRGFAGAGVLITVTKKDWSSIKLLVGKEKDGLVPVRKNGDGFIFLFAKSAAAALAPPVHDLRRAEQKKAKKPAEK